jgi:predicted P-loop ATPase
MSNKNNGESTKIARLENYLNKKYDLRINEITNDLEGKLKKDEGFEPLNINDLHYELLHAGFTRFKEDLGTLFASSKLERFDPFKDYFESLPKYNPINEPDYILELSKFVETDSQDWFEIVLKKFLVQMCGQSIGTIAFNKHCLTFVGKQHDGKTTFLEWLIPPKLKAYIKKGFDFGGKKEAKFSLVQNMLINLDELASFDRKELNNEFKSVLSESLVKFRPLYSNQEVSFNRRASFVASTNQLEFLTDETGNVRWLVFKIDKISHDNGNAKGYNKNINLDNVWRQAYHLLKNKFEYNLTKHEVATQEAQNKRYIKTTDEMECIRKFFEASNDSDLKAEFMTTGQVTDLVVRNGVSRTNRNFVGKALRTEGFEIVSKYNKEKKFSEKGYYLIYNGFPSS